MVEHRQPFLTEFASEELRLEWDLDTGNPGIGLFANALQVWAVLQNRDVTVGEAALAFNCTPEIIRAAVGQHYWMYLAGEVIQHEGDCD